jgi:hypothetical protein
VTVAAFSETFLSEKEKANMKVLSRNTLKGTVAHVVEEIGNYQLRDVDSEVVQQMIHTWI